MADDAMISRIARLEQAEEDMRADIAEIKTDVKKIVSTLSEMSGGKKAILGMFALAGGVIGIIISWLAIPKH